MLLADGAVDNIFVWKSTQLHNLSADLCFRNPRRVVLIGSGDLFCNGVAIIINRHNKHNAFLMSENEHAP